MRLGVYYPKDLPLSAQNYIENILQRLVPFGVKVNVINNVCDVKKIMKDVELLWDPRSMGGLPPCKELAATNLPFIVTVHGAAPLSMLLLEFTKDLKGAFRQKINNIKNLYNWRKFRTYCDAIITVSHYAKFEIQKYLKLPKERIFPIYHGVDLKTFKTSNNGIKNNKPYFLHVSQYQPKKNINRILEAFRMLVGNKPELIMIVPGYNAATKIKKVRFILDRQSPQNLAKWYREAFAFVFPSLHETFGMPIVEAMASGCPVITSNITACPEIAGDAALLVDPRSVKEIATAMKRLITDEKLRETLRQKGLKRANMFTWEESAKEHLRVFEEVLKKR